MSTHTIGTGIFAWTSVAIFPISVNLAYLSLGRGRSRLGNSKNDIVWGPFIAYGFLLALETVLVHYSTLTLAELGLKATRMPFDWLIGFGCGALWSLSYPLVHRAFRSARRAASHSYLQSGRLTAWVAVFFIGAFAEELWRAICIRAFQQVGYPVMLIVIITVIGFISGHPAVGVAGAVRIGAFGAIAALLFIRFGSVAMTFSAHLIGNLIGFWWIRRTRRVANPSTPPK